MRVLFCNYEFPPIGGGGANANAYLFREFAGREDLRVDFITSAAGARDETEEPAPNIRLHRLAVGKSRLHYWTQREVMTFAVRARRKADRLLAAHRYDLGHAFFGFPSGAVLWRQVPPIPYIVSLRGSDVPGFNPRFALQYVVLRPLFRRIWRGAARVVANSAGLAVLARRTAPGLACEVIPNGIDVDEFRSAPGEGREGEILCVSRLVARKGVQHLVEAMPSILRQRPEARLTVVGEGNLDHALRARVRELGIAERVDFRGLLPHGELPPVYRRAQIFVQPSFYEGMSNTVLEAMASGLPIVASGEGGREELFDGNALTVPFGDAAALAGAIVRLLGNSVERRRMGERSREIALRFSWRRTAERYLDLYRQIAGGRE